MWPKLATLDRLKIKVFQNKSYGAIIFVHIVINKILSCDSNYVVDVVMWPTFGNSSVSMGKVIIALVLLGLDQKKQYFWGVLLTEVQYFRSGSRYGLEILHQCSKRVKTQNKKVLEDNSNVCKKTWQVNLKNIGWI